MALILASGSPRRRELMALITPDYTVITSDVDEGKIAADTPAHLAQSLASAKARAVAKLHPADTVLGFDTVVDCGGEVFGKPQDEADALRMLRALSGRTHKVHTGVCICKGGRAAATVETTLVHFSTIVEDDLRAYQWLIKHADATLLRRIIRSEYLRAWLPLFSRAFRSLRDCRGGAMVWLNEVDSADLLVAVADFFTRVHGLKWIAVCGVVEKTVVVIFRGDGSRDIGRLADACFYDVGSAGGHRNLGRAEFPLAAIPAGTKPAEFIFQRLHSRKLRPVTASAAPLAENAGQQAVHSEKLEPAPVQALAHGA